MTTAQSHAPINWKDRYVTLADSNQFNHVIARPAIENYTVIVWEDNRTGDTAIYAQKIDNSDGLPRWYPLDGVKVADGEKQHNPVATYDTLGGVYIAWEQTDDNGDVVVMAQMLSLVDGSLAWNAQGIRVSLSGQGFNSKDPAIIGDQLGAYIACTDGKNQGDPNIRVRYLKNDQSAWSQGYLAVADSTWPESKPVITTDGVYASTGGEIHMGVYVGWLDDSTDYTHVRGRHVYYDSMPCPRLLLNSNDNIDCSNLRIAETGPIPGNGDTYDYPSAGASFTWIEHDGGIHNKIQAQNIDWIPTFTGNPYYRIKGIQYSPSLAVCDYQYIKTDQAMDCFPESSAGDPGSGYYYCYVSWTDARRNGGTYGATDIYMNYFDVLSGSVIPGAGSNGIAVTDLSTFQEDSDIEIMADGTVTVCWQDYRSGSSDVYMQQYDAGNSSEAWQCDGWPVTRAVGGQTHPLVGNEVFVFEDGRRSDQNIYSQTIMQSWDDEFGPSKMTWRGQYSFVDTSLSALSVDAVMDSLSNTYTVWSSSDGENSQVYIQKHDSYGTPVWQNGGVPLGSSAYSNTSPKVCLGNEGATFVTWLGNGLKYCHVDSDGTPSSPFSVVASASSISISRDDDGSDHAYIAYTASNLVKVVEVDNSGNSTQLSHGTLFDYGNGSQIVTRLAPHGYYIVSRHTQSPPRIYYSSETGNPQWSNLFDNHGFATGLSTVGSGGGIIIVAHNETGASSRLTLYCSSWNPTGIEICADDNLNVISTGMSVCGGYDAGTYTSAAYAAWCTYDTSRFEYQVRCNAAYNGGGTAFNMIWPPVLEANSGLTATDIAYTPEPVATWAGKGPSGSGRSAKTQQIDFSDSTAFNVWTAGGEFVSAHIGGVYQQSPLITMYPDDTAPSIFFLDRNNAMNFQVLGARVADNSGSMRWMKQGNTRNASAASEINIHSPYPLPYSLSSGANLMVPLSITDGAVTGAILFNSIGQEVIRINMVSQGHGKTNLLIPAASLSTQLKPGMYFISIRTTKGLISKPIPVIR